MQDIEKKLYRYAEYQRRIKELQQQIDEVLQQHNALLDGMLKAPSLDDVRIQGGFTSDPVYSAVQKMIDVYGARIEAIKNEISNLFYLVDDIMRMINEAGLTEKEREYIQYRYFEGLRVSQIAARMDYSEKQVWRLKQSALKKMKHDR
ncbi:MAG: sigma factor-like helix-turn-helix DNA-binding protein [Christensenella hongkongensis]|uniref:sigma factor-like helix-turn-helix DNA-binding protein n=1 Tax=Christensenella hongkongensis TaxID=270498 RepID=UPI002A74DE15|nr:sigma factor-like helix-turn-helix DNA-binding protein [Christensenella hongkongensis]MDY3003867.1 sigma factor-like helix-turn-helix DNA-binding protein [Christensenella hongkongensis]